MASADPPLLSSLPLGPAARSRAINRSRIVDASSARFDCASVTRRMSARDERAFVEFHDLYHDRLFRYAFVLTRGRDDAAAEIVQETLLRVVRHIRAFDDEAAFWDWLARLARSAAADAGRRRARWLAFFDRWAWILANPTRGADEPSLAQDDADEVLREALSKLSEEFATLLRWKYFGTCLPPNRASARPGVRRILRPSWMAISRNLIVPAAAS